MGLCASKITPQSDLSTLLQDFRKALYAQHTFYAKVLESESFTPETFQYHTDLEEKIQDIREQCKDLITDSNHSREYNRLRFEHFNATMEFKRKLHQQYLNKQLIVDDRLLHSKPFRTFFSLLPDVENSNSLQNYCLEEKQKADFLLVRRQVTGESSFQTCPHCGIDVTHTSVKEIVDPDTTQCITTVSEKGVRKRTMAASRSLSSIHEV
jgi:hypothetical protein